MRASIAACLSALAAAAPAVAVPEIGFLPVAVAPGVEPKIAPAAVERVWRSELKGRADVAQPCGNEVEFTQACALTKSTFQEVGLFQIRGDSVSLLLRETETGKQVFFARVDATEASLKELLVQAYSPAAHLGSIRAQNLPSDARVYVDGLPLESNPLAVTAGRHEVLAEGVPGWTGPSAAGDPPATWPFVVGGALIIVGTGAVGTGAVLAAASTSSGGYPAVTTPLVVGGALGAILIPAGAAIVVLRGLTH
jgi:hypothetical protein